MDTAEALHAVAAQRRQLTRARSKARELASRLELSIVAAADDGATQREIAEQADVSQPYVAQVIRAHKRFRPHSPLGEHLVSKREQVLQVVHSYGGANVAVFGSVAAGTDGPQSDIDLMLDIPPDMGLITLGKMERDVCDVLGVRTDLVPRRLLKSEVNNTARRVVVPL